MFPQFLSIGLIALLGAMMPGPDFAIVTKNSLLHSRQSGCFTSFGIGAATLIHMTYCVLGLAIVIFGSVWLFNLIKYIGAIYLIYLGMQSLLSAQSPLHIGEKKRIQHYQSNFTSFKQGFLCNLLNPKATLFFLALFTVFIKPETPMSWQIALGLEITFVATTWFCFLTFVLSHRRIKQLLERAEVYIAKMLGIFLIVFGVALAFVRP
jgi:RhtB (resistance to homoserine/threonine) family protein